MSEHTPGPWKVIVPEQNSGWASALCIDADSERLAVAHVALSTGQRARREAEANAALIAAAPDLLDALDDLYRAVAGLLVTDPTHHVVADATAEAGVLAFLALQKARGEWVPA